MGTPIALNDISFIKTNGGLGRANGSDDVISGLIFGGLGLSFVETTANGVTTDPDVTGFDSVDANTYVRRFTYPEELAGCGIEFTPKTEGVTLTAKQKAVNALHYHITEFFRMNPEGEVYVLVKSGSGQAGNASAADIATLQTYAGGNIRQTGVFNSTMPDIAAVQAACTALEEAHRPLSVVLTYSGNGVTLAALKTATESLAADGMCNVSLLIGCDADTELQAALGDFAFYGCIGACIGAVSKAAVHESIAWVGKFPLGLKAPALFNGNLIRNIATADLEELNGNRCLFPVIHAGDADNYFNDSQKCHTSNHYNHDSQLHQTNRD